MKAVDFPPHVPLLPVSTHSFWSPLFACFGAFSTVKYYEILRNCFLFLPVIAILEIPLDHSLFSCLPLDCPFMPLPTSTIVISWTFVSNNICRCCYLLALCLLGSLGFSVLGISASFGKSSLKNSKSFWIISSNQKLARALANSPKSITRTSKSCCLATSGTNTARSVPSRRRDFVKNWHLFPRLF